MRGRSQSGMEETPPAKKGKVEKAKVDQRFERGTARKETDPVPTELRDEDKFLRMAKGRQA